MNNIYSGNERIEKLYSKF